MSGTVYILISQKDNKTYTGSTDNLERRLEEHFSGKVKSTKNRLPLKIIYTETFPSLIEARVREKYYKSCSCRKKMKIILKNII